MLNHHIAKLHGGCMAIRFDDTNPAKVACAPGQAAAQHAL